MMKYLVLILILPLITINAQRIGNTIVEKKATVYPPKMFGADLIFSDGGFGLGTFYRYEYSDAITGTIDLSFSESKNEREIEYVDYYGQKFTVGKVNRSFLLPLNIGIQYRLFRKSLNDNLRPYVNASIGPTFVLTTPYSEEFFTSFKKAQLHMAAGGYIGIGANFGISKKNLIGINFRYYVIELLGNGIERLGGFYDKSLGGFFLTINIGTMFY